MELAIVVTVFAPDAKRDAAAEKIAAGAGQWLRISLRETRGAFKAGSRFYGIPASAGDGSIYYASLRYCSCKDYEKRGQGCKHQRAVAAHVSSVRKARQQEQQESAPADSAPTARPTYEDLYPPCRGGCGDVADTKDAYCDRCASDREWRARLAARREQGAEIARRQIAAGLTFADVINPLAE
jgi:hypothetical protein